MEIGPAGVPPSKFVISPLSGNIGIDSGHDTVMLPYPPIKLPKPHVTRYLSLWHQYSTTKRAVLKKHFPISRASGFMFIYMTHKLFWQQTAVKCNAVTVGAVGEKLRTGKDSRRIFCHDGIEQFSSGCWNERSCILLRCCLSIPLYGKYM